MGLRGATAARGARAGVRERGGWRRRALRGLGIPGPASGLGLPAHLI